ncbi:MULTISPECIES: heavy metal translocating P-type ATPase [Chitinophagaceae]
MKLPFNNKRFTFLFVAAIAMLVLEVVSILGWSVPMPFAPIFYGIIVLATGYKIILSGLKSLSKFNFGSVSLLMLVAVVSAFGLGEYSEGAVVMALYVLGEALEDVGIDNSKSSLEELVSKAPREAMVKGGSEPVQVDKIPIGSVVEVRPGSYIPMDGKIVFGHSAIDEAAITGEPIAKDKKVGDAVFAGTLNQQGYLEIQTTKLSADTTFSKIIQLTFQANANKSERQKFIQKFAKKYTPTILVLALFLFLVYNFLLHKGVHESLNMAISLLVIACPCALVISTPVSIYAAIGNASSKGAIIKGGKFLEALAEVKIVALDKTRTITYGKPVVSDMFMLNGTSEEELLACTAGAEVFSEHPVAQAIVDASKKAGFEPHAAHKYQSVLGKGAVAECLVCKDETIRAGNLDYIGETEKIGEEEHAIIQNLSKEGKTSIAVSFGKGVAGVFGLQDEIKPESAQAIQELTALGIVPVMLTGDSAQAATYVAQQVGIDNVYGHLLPEGKAERIKQFIAEGIPTAMVGDGINDAPAMAMSTVGIAMGAAGSDVAIETASIALMNDRISLVPFLVRLSRATVRQIKANTIGSILVKIVFVLLAFLGYSNLVLAIFADVGVLMIVILLSLRLRTFK